jgi:hypothetical protein
MQLKNIEVRQKYYVHVLWESILNEDNEYILHRKVIDPLTDYSGEDRSVQNFCAATFTPELVKEYEEFLAAQAAPTP